MKVDEYKNIEDGYSVIIYQYGKNYFIRLHDDDADKYFDGVRVFSDLEKAKQFAEKTAKGILS